MVWILSICLFIVMLAQGTAFRPADLAIAQGHGRPVWQELGLRMLALPVIAGLCAWMFDLGMSAGQGLLLTALAPASLGALAIGGAMGANLPRLTTMIGLTTVAALIWLPLVAGSLLESHGIGGLFATMALWVALPFGLGMALRARVPAAVQRLATLASVLGGVMMLIAIWAGWGPGAGASAQAALLMALAAAVLGLWGGRVLGQGDGDAAATALTLGMAEIAVPIGVAARLFGGDFAAAALPAALYGVAMYAVAVALILLRLRRRV